MNTTVWQGIALIGMIASLPLLSWGTANDVPALTVVGAALLVVCMALLTALRYFNTEEEN